MAKAAKMRVEIPRNPVELLALAAKIYAKHVEMADSSPLNNMQDHSWKTEGPTVATAQNLHKTAEEYKEKMEKTYRDRDLLIQSITQTGLASRDVLTGIHRANMKRMGDWGFSVNDTPRSKPKQK